MTYKELPVLIFMGLTRKRYKYENSKFRAYECSLPLFNK